MSDPTRYTDADCIRDTGGPLREPFGEWWSRYLDGGDVMDSRAVYLFELLNHPGCSTSSKRTSTAKGS